MPRRGRGGREGRGARGGAWRRGLGRGYSRWQFVEQMGDGTMKERTSGQKAPSSAVQGSNLGATAGAKGVALAPPTYGADSMNYERLNEGQPGLVQLHQSIQARASTTGQDVFFRPPLLQHPATEAPSTAGLIQAKGNLGGERQNPMVAQRPNQTGLPDNLKTGIESLSGMSLDHVRVHYNSAQPAQLKRWPTRRAATSISRRGRNGICRTRPGTSCSRRRGG